jgi:hypothetical protein
MNHRPRLVVIVIGWLFITVGALGLLRDWLPLLTPQAAQHAAALRAEGAAMLALIWTVRGLAIVGGAFLIRGAPWARWLLAGWMAFHVALSAGHSFQALALHVLIFAGIAYVLFRPQPRATDRASAADTHTS